MARGDVPVEALANGSIVTTASGARQLICRLGHRRGGNGAIIPLWRVALSASKMAVDGESVMPLFPRGRRIVLKCNDCSCDGQGCRL